MTASLPALECRGLELGYERGPVVEGLSLDVARGESVALLGPSGSGKTTVLSAVAGFIQPTAGEIRLGGSVVATASGGVAPERRSVGMVFQHYALWPHLTALETVAYPIRRRGASRSEARAEALALLGRLGVGELAGRRPAELSGGEQQRVGVARAIARQPELFLFDEPTAHLDTPLRAALQQELADRRARSGAAALTATHDVSEALAVADRVALLRDGRLVQLGRPLEVYEQPVDLWSARLTGSASVLAATLVRPGVAAVDGAVVPVRGGSGRAIGGSVRLLVRPDWVSLGGELVGHVTGLWFRGPHTDYRLSTHGGEVELRQPGPPNAALGERVTWRLERGWVLPD